MTNGLMSVGGRGRLRLSELPVGFRLGLVLAVPLLALAGLAAVVLAPTTGADDRLAGAATDGLLDALQRERLAAARRFGDPSDAARTGYLAQAAQTDQAIERYRQAPVTRNTGALDTLPTLRARVVAGDPRTEEVALLREYGALVDDLVVRRESIADAAPSGPVAQTSRAGAALTAAKSALADAGALVIRVAVDEPITAAALAELAGARAAYQSQLRRFQSVAAPELRAELDRALTDQRAVAGADLTAGVARTPPGTAPGVAGGAARATEMSLAQLDALRPVEERLDRAAVDAENAVRVAERRVLLLGAAAGLLVVALSVALAIAVARSLARARHALRRDVAAEQATLRTAVQTTFVNLARRSSRLVDGLIEQLDAAERDEADPDRLATLFRFDHLATRMRHTNDSLLVLAGSDAARVRDEPIALFDLLRAAQSQIEQYQRVEFGQVDRDVAVAPDAVDAVVHALAELCDNAARFSPPDQPVLVEGRRTGDGAVVQITDRGLGADPELLTVLNQRLAEPPALDVADSRSMGLAVVSRLARRHGLRVELRRAVPLSPQSQHRPPSTLGGGTTAVVRLPAAIVRIITPTLPHSIPLTAPSLVDAAGVPVLPRPLERSGALPGGEPIEVPTPRAASAGPGLSGGPARFVGHAHVGGPPDGHGHVNGPPDGYAHVNGPPDGYARVSGPASGRPREAPEGRPREAPEGRPRGAPEGRPREAPEGRPREAPEGRPREAPDGRPHANGLAEHRAPDGGRGEHTGGLLPRRTPNGHGQPAPEHATSEQPAPDFEDLDPDAVRAMLSSYQDALDRFQRGRDPDA